jgi:hypothetical protein
MAPKPERTAGILAAGYLASVEQYHLLMPDVLFFECH